MKHFKILKLMLDCKHFVDTQLTLLSKGMYIERCFLTRSARNFLFQDLLFKETKWFLWPSDVWRSNKCNTLLGQWRPYHKDDAGEVETQTSIVMYNNRISLLVWSRYSLYLFLILLYCTSNGFIESTYEKRQALVMNYIWDVWNAQFKARRWI